MSERAKHERVHGPYKHGQRWRVVFVAANGTREVESYESLDAANQAVSDARATSTDRTLGSAVDEYLATRSDRERATAGYRLRAVLGSDERLLVSLTAPVVRDMWGARNRATVAGATLHSELGYVQRFGEYCVAQGWICRSPFADLKCDAEIKRGKPKLRVNASKQLLAFLMADDSLEATGVLTAFGLALRASAVVNRRVEDLDDNGWLLWVRDDKTEAGDREIEVPEYLRARLLPLVDGLAPHDLIFRGNSRHWLHYHTVRLCAAAGVPRVTPHGLRGSGASNAVRLGGSVEQVARAIGHADGGRTLRRHYLAPGAEESARARQVAALVTDLGTRADFAFPNNSEEVLNES